MEGGKKFLDGALRRDVLRGRLKGCKSSWSSVTSVGRVQRVKGRKGLDVEAVKGFDSFYFS